MMKKRAFLDKYYVLYVVVLFLVSACQAPLHLQRRKVVLPDVKPDETAFTTPVLTITTSVPTPEEQIPESWQDKMRGKLDLLMRDTLLQTTQVGICIYDLNDNTLLYGFNAHHRMRPASCQKLVTAISALALLGADYRYTPTVLSPGWGWCWDDAVSGITDFGAKGKRQNASTLYSEKRERSLSDVLMPMMKNSDNLLAESMLWQLSGGGDLSTLKLKDCQEKVAVVMRQAGLDPDAYVVADGSGLSLYNYTSAHALAMLLRYAHAVDSIFTALYPTLPVAGVDGTLQNRMKGTKAAENVRAKTGTVTGVSSLSGYVTASNGHLLCFSIINQGVVKMAHGRTFQDKVCEILASPVQLVSEK